MTTLQGIGGAAAIRELLLRQNSSGDLPAAPGFHGPRARAVRNRAGRSLFDLRREVLGDFQAARDVARQCDPVALLADVLRGHGFRPGDVKRALGAAEAPPAALSRPCPRGALMLHELIARLPDGA